MTDFRIGHGYDVHRLVPGRALILGGVDIPFRLGLEGHSDADVLLHSLADAMLGACAMRDIGYHFPDTDDRYKDISSIILLEKTYTLIKERGYTLGNADITVIAQAPRLSPYIDMMRNNIAAALKTDISWISVKATTEEHMGFTGSSEGIASHAVVLLSYDI